MSGDEGLDSTNHKPANGTANGVHNGNGHANGHEDEVTSLDSLSDSGSPARVEEELEHSASSALTSGAASSSLPASSAGHSPTTTNPRKRSFDTYSADAHLNGHTNGEDHFEPPAKRQAVEPTSGPVEFNGPVAVPIPVPVPVVASVPTAGSAHDFSIKLLMSTKQVGSIIGRSGATIKAFREQSGARITISESQPGCAERIVTLTGSTDVITRAFGLIVRKIFEESVSLSPGTAAQALQLKLIIHQSQAGSIIGKGGANIKEIREATGAQIAVSQEVMPFSTERTVSLQGSSEELSMAIANICQTLKDNPAKGSAIPYRPQPRPVWGDYAPHVSDPHMAAAYAYGYPHYAAAPAATTAAAAAGGASSTQQMTIPNELIGAIIGRGGAKINEIRAMSGAQIKISDAQPGSAERIITVIGTPEASQMAYYLLNNCLTRS